jgi:hypothetical protein
MSCVTIAKFFISKQSPVLGTSLCAVIMIWCTLVLKYFVTLQLLLPQTFVIFYYSELLFA